MSRVPVLVPGLTSVRSVVAGSTTTCAALTNGEAWCWGDGDVGQLGNGTERRSATPVRVKGLADVTALAAGGRRFCALRRYGLVSCWGEGAGEAVVERLHQPSTVPVAVPGIAGATSISGSCAFVATVSVLCWGGAGRPTELLKLGDGLMPAPGPGAWVLGKRVVLRSVVVGAAARCPARLTVRADVLGASVSAPATPMSSGGRCRVSLAMVLPERPRATVRVTISTSAGVLRSLKATRFN